MKKNIFLLYILLISVLAYSEVSPLSIEGLKLNTVKPTTITLEKQIADLNSYTSFDASFYVNDIKEYALLSKPKSVKPKNGYPVIILIHGHIPPTQYSTTGSYKYMFNRYATSEFVVIKPDLRSHGRSESGDNYDVKIEKLYFAQDLIQIINSLDSLDFVDPNNIFLMGHSNGGDGSLRVLSVFPNKIRAASLWAPVTVTLAESNYFYKGRGKNSYGLQALNNPKASAELLNITKETELSLKKVGIQSTTEIDFNKYLKYIKTPIIIRHPDTDQSVPYYWSENFIKRFKDSGNSNIIELINYPGEDHNISKSQASAQKDDLNWFRSLLEK